MPPFPEASPAPRRPGGRVAARRLRRCALAALVAWPAARVAAQTIADYGRAQRQLLEATMIQNAQRAAALSSSPAGSAASAPGLPVLASTPTAVVPAGWPGLSSSDGVARPVAPRLPTPTAAAAAPEAQPRVHGVYASPTSVRAEIQVDAAVYWLAPGDVVPGTRWSVAAIAPDHVELARPVAGWREAEAPRGPEGVRLRVQRRTLPLAQPEAR